MLIVSSYHPQAWNAGEYGVRHHLSAIKCGDDDSGWQIEGNDLHFIMAFLKILLSFTNLSVQALVHTI